MPNYASAWEAVWAPYAAYGRTLDKDDPIFHLVDEIDQTKLLPTLRLLNTFYQDVDQYRETCRMLARNPNDAAAKQREALLGGGLRRQMGNFVETGQKAVVSCDSVIQNLKISIQFLKRDKEHEPNVRNIVAEVTKISSGLTTDLQAYGPKLDETLATIRRNP